MTLGTPNHWRAPKRPKNFVKAFSISAYLLSKAVRFGHGGAKLVLYLELHLISVRSYQAIETCSGGNHCSAFKCQIVW